MRAQSIWQAVVMVIVSSKYQRTRFYCIMLPNLATLSIGCNEPNMSPSLQQKYEIGKVYTVFSLDARYCRKIQPFSSVIVIDQSQDHISIPCFLTIEPLRGKTWLDGTYHSIRIRKIFLIQVEDESGF